MQPIKTSSDIGTY